MTAYWTRGGRLAGQKMPSYSTLICDAKDCRTTPLRGDSAALLRKVARELGWGRVEGKDYCPGHACRCDYAYIGTQMVGDPTRCERCHGLVDDVAAARLDTVYAEASARLERRNPPEETL